MIKNSHQNIKKSQKEVINYYLENQIYNVSTEEIRISLKKVREIGLKYWSLSDRVASVKENRFVSFESSLERDFIYHIEFDKNVYRYCEQPIRLYYSKKEIQTFYVPDFYVEYIEGRKKEIIEIKYEEDLKKNKNKYEEKFKVARDFCLENNMNFRVITEKEIKNERLWNIKFLLNYKNPNTEVDYNYVNLIESMFVEYKAITPKLLISRNKNLNEEQKAILIYTLWYCLANDLLTVNLDLKINMNTVISKCS